MHCIITPYGTLNSTPGAGWKGNFGDGGFGQMWMDWPGGLG